MGWQVVGIRWMECVFVGWDVSFSPPATHSPEQVSLCKLLAM